jgi:hypothetical protein
MKNIDVAKSWVRGERAAAGHFSTDGTDLFSYNLRIATRNSYGMTVFNYTASGSFISVTTSKHVGYALRAAGKANLAPPT